MIHMPFVATEPRCTGTTGTGIACARPNGHTGPHRPPRTRSTRTTANDMPTANVHVRTIDGATFPTDPASADHAVIRVNGGAWLRVASTVVGTIGDETIVAVTDTRGARVYVSATDTVDAVTFTFHVPGVDDDTDTSDDVADDTDTDDAPDDVSRDAA
jgi:hypothetical protein